MSVKYEVLKRLVRAVDMALTMLLKVFPETPLRNALTAGWISIGNLWMFGGLLAMMKKAKEMLV